jgi:hypothetical protein
MKLNSPESIETAKKIFRLYGSWTAARAAATRRDPDGVLVIPMRASHSGAGDDEIAPPAARKSG